MCPEHSQRLAHSLDYLFFFPPREKCRVRELCRNQDSKMLSNLPRVNHLERVKAPGGSWCPVQEASTKDGGGVTQ